MLRVLNFLPNDYVQRRQRRRANLVCLLVGVSGLMVIGLGVGVTVLRAVGIAAARAAVEEEYRQASLRIKDLERLEGQKTSLLHKAELSATLLERVPRSHVLARLANYLPAKTSLTSLSMQEERIMVTVPVDPEKSKTADKKKSKSKAKKRPARIAETRIRFRLDGLAETDVQVAEYISRLATDGLFDEVDLQFSEEFPYEEGVLMRRFQLSFLLDKQAAKTMENEPGLPPQPKTQAATRSAGRTTETPS